ncbi:Ankyrin repeat-containing protein [Fusarium austroafricanum]|uniref:Ankyrin repeat-containing protein n=1 Tax=Fusarium austroafricanum TaxID=2364996 RepID=A0A8H4KCT4_9HYPO|nr:Ankyrin repeat-containing protein [Fusarium austroafricanum]
MSTTARPPTAIARVQWWNHANVYVLCPFCAELHHHGFVGYDQNQLRVSHCDNRLPRRGEISDEYQIRFPSHHFEIDKDNLFFVAGGARLPEKAPREEIDLLRARFREAVDRKVFWVDFPEDIVEKLDTMLGNVVLGDISSARKFLTTILPLHDIFLNGVESWKHPLSEGEEGTTQPRETSGKAVLQYASCEKYPEIVKLLLDEGADVNAADLEGRTALMEAAYWGRLENVQHLLEHGADKSLVCIYKDQLRRAIDFARPTNENQKTRSQHRIDTEDVYTMDLYRREIVRLLDDSDSDEGTHQLGDFFFSSSASNPTMLSQYTHYSLPTESKTVAYMVRGGHLPEIPAMSGWIHKETVVDEGTVFVAGREWTPEVLRLCEVIGFTPQPHEYDKGVPGQYNACHAEKQLIAYFVFKHLFLPSELAIPEDPDEGVDSLAEMMSLTSLTKLSASAISQNMIERAQVREERAYQSKLVELYENRPLTSLTTANILVSRRVCPDCELFLKRVNEELGLSLCLLNSNIHIIQ